MKYHKQVTVEIFSRRSMRKPDDFIARLQHHCESLPELLPEKWGFWEPLRNKFDITQLETMIPNDRGGAADRITWKRGTNPKVDGIFGCAHMAGRSGLNIHASEWFEYTLNTVNDQFVIEYIKQSCLKFDGDFAMIDSCCDEYQEKYATIQNRYGAPTLGGFSSLVTHTFRHWLPDLYWGTVFGSAYVKMFGLEKLLSAPAYKVEKLSEECVYLQLSPSLNDLYDDFDSVQKVREAVKKHLGNDAFFNLEKAYPLKGPIGEPPDYAVAGPEILNFVPPDPIGTVFQVPSFQLIDDEYTIKKG
jgi:hypothetical protein